jgi:hypothetical protein
VPSTRPRSSTDSSSASRRCAADGRNSRDSGFAFSRTAAGRSTRPPGLPDSYQAVAYQNERFGSSGEAREDTFARLSRSSGTPSRRRDARHPTNIRGGSRRGKVLGVSSSLGWLPVAPAQKQITRGRGLATFPAERKRPTVIQPLALLDGVGYMSLPNEQCPRDTCPGALVFAFSVEWYRAKPVRCQGAAHLANAAGPGACGRRDRLTDASAFTARARTASGIAAGWRRRGNGRSCYRNCAARRAGVEAGFIPRSGAARGRRCAHRSRTSSRRRSGLRPRGPRSECSRGRSRGRACRN